jgi:hypothetical protein
MTRRTRFFLVLFAAFYGPLALAAEIPRAAPQALADINQMGASAFLAQFDDEQVDTLYQHLQTGDPAWLALAPKLAPAADGANAIGLTISLAYALPKNAGAVLVVTTEQDDILGVGRVCSIPFIEDTVQDRPAYKRQALEAVGAVKDPALAKAKDRCLMTLKKSS